MTKLTIKDRRSKADEESYSALDKSTGTIYLVGEITHRQASQFRQHLRTLERLKRVHGILVEINSPGGDVEAGLMIIDSIEMCKKAVTTRVTGQAMSMAALILASGSKREALPRASIMLHQGSYRLSVPYDEIDTEVSELKRLEAVCNTFLDQRCGKEPQFWEKKCSGKNLYLTAELALADNLIDAIVRKP
jgi:ATP-dependent Clp protease protease subunit